MASRNNPIHKYLKAEEFTELCSEMRVYLGRYPDKLLEAYEKHGLIRPVYRLNIAEDYKKLLFRYNHAKENEKSTISLPEEHKDIHDFLQDRLGNYHVTYPPWIDRTLEEGHPLDWAYKGNKSYIEKPSQETFRHWREFEIVEGILYDNPQPGRIAEHYYAHWQVFLFEEADRCFSITLNPFLLSQSSDISFKKTTLSLSQWTQEFEILAEYQFDKQLYFEKYMNQTSNNLLEGELLEEYHKKLNKQVGTIFIQILEERWIEFLKKLCETFILYEELERIRLSKFLKSYIYAIVELFLKSTKLSYPQIVDKVGNIIGGEKYFYRLPLEMILPDEEREKREQAKNYISSLKDKYNSLFPEEIISDADVCNIIEEADRQGNDTLLTKVIEIEKEWWEDNIFRHEKIWSHIRSLVTAVETFSRAIFPTKNDLYNCINESLKGQYESLKQPFDNYFKGSVIKTNNPSEFLEKLDIIIKTPNNIKIQNDLINLKFLLIANLIRNFVSHSSKIDVKLFGSRFFMIYQSLIFSIFYLFKNKTV